MKKYALFDLDHTLIPYDTQTLFCNFVIKKQRWRGLLMVLFLPFGIARGFKIATTALAKRAFLSYLLGVNQETLKHWSQEFAQEIKVLFYPEMLSIIEKHREAGCCLILNTASPHFYAEEIAKVLGMDAVYATAFEVNQKINWLPKIIGENNKRHVKLKRMEKDHPALVKGELKETSWAYSDSAADLPLLSLAKYVGIVHPKRALLEFYQDLPHQLLKPRNPYSTQWIGWLDGLKQILGIFNIG
jgi:HAD superfamily hydrolase (TIGR01490 family)